MERTELEAAVRRVVTEIVDRLEAGPPRVAARREETEPISPQKVAPSATAVAETLPGTPPAATPASAPATPLRVAIGSDHGGFQLKAVLVAHLHALGHKVSDVGTHGPDAVDYPDFAKKVALAVSAGQADRGVVIDGAGIGSGMVANKVRGVRAAVCHDLKTVLNSRDHNDANVLSIGSGIISAELAREMVETWLRTPFGGGRHAPRVTKINEMDEYRPS